MKKRQKEERRRYGKRRDAERTENHENKTKKEKIQM
jgi:hypothetical protein